MPLKDALQREFYLTMAATERWSKRTLQAKIYGMLFERTAIATKPEELINLPENYTVETLMHKHASKPRNLNIASVFYKAGFIEAWGRGYKKIQDGFNDAKLPMAMLLLLALVSRTIVASCPS